MLVPPAYDTAVTADNLVRRDTSMEALASLAPAFDKRYGTVTAGNSSPLTDGGAAVLLMAEDKARAEGREPLAFVRSWATAAVDPGGQLLMGPALAIPMALERAGIELSDVDVVEMHEAFGAQVASNIQALESETWAREKLGRTRPVGVVDRDRLNVNGGSIAIGHPFGATGARITTTLANEMKRRDARLGLALRVRAGRHGLRHGAGAMSDPQAFTREKGEDGVLVLTLDVPGEKVNTLGKGLIAGFEALLADVDEGRDGQGRRRPQRQERQLHRRCGHQGIHADPVGGGGPGALPGLLTRSSTVSSGRACPWWRRSTERAWAVAPSSRSPAATGSPPTTRRRRSACPR